ncbi:hypothetical protein J6590_068796 [Homalodisca vitripennis]|nr:hypothetical protein J6590_068796 [Homalodisca vitripennis]
MPPPLINQEPTDAAPAAPAASATIPQPAAGAASTPARRPTVASAAPPADAAPTIQNAAGVPRNCAVCLTQRSTHLVFPCGHLCMCTECSDTLPGYHVNLQCPL